MQDKTKEEKEQLVKDVKNYVVDYLKRERPWVLLMDNEILDFINKKQSGTIAFAVRIHKGEAQDMVVEVTPGPKTVKFNFTK